MGDSPGNPRHCRECGRELSAWEQFCKECGAPPGSDDSQEQDQQPSVQDEGWSTRKKLAIFVSVIVVIALVVVAIAATLFLGLGENPVSVPPLELDYTYNETDGTVTIQHIGEDVFDSEQVYIRGDDIVGTCAQWHELDSHTGPDEYVTPVDNITVEVTSDRYFIQLVWNSTEGGTRFIQSEATGPNRREGTAPDVSGQCEDSDSGSGSEFDIGPGLALVFAGIGGVALTLGGRVLRRRL